ncbi:MAG: cyclic pyranopterin monophosphate synthase MoaC [Clostridia bacterium]|nr:cyclic pyranopterin monophosphate synthase MoaC [Clostridia bacterium]
MGCPVIGFSAYSGTGKTTVMERVIRELTKKGLCVGVVKRDGHDFEIDHPGKDSYRHAQAGAQTVVIASAQKTAVIQQAGSTLEACVSRIQNVDVILVEGFKHAAIPRIGLCRKETGKGLPEPPENYIAVVADDHEIETGAPRFSFGDAAGIADFIIREIQTMQTQDFTHFTDQGRARMVDVGNKDVTCRTATAAGRVLVNQSTFSLIQSGGVKKGDVLTVAQIAGIMAAKHTPDWIPMCHPVPLNGIDLKLFLDTERLSVEIEATARCDGKTGVEMEALTAVSCAALTVYDMCKAVQRDMVISDIRLLKKSGGVHGDYEHSEKR